MRPDCTIIVLIQGRVGRGESETPVHRAKRTETTGRNGGPSGGAVLPRGDSAKTLAGAFAGDKEGAPV